MAVCSFLIPRPWSFTRPWCIIYLSVFPVWLFSGLRSGGEIKQTPFWSWQAEPEGSPPSPNLTEAAFDKGAVCYKLLRKKRNTTGRVIWCYFDPLSSLRWKGFQFLPDEEDHFSTEHQYGLQSSAEILIRDKLLYIVCVCILCSNDTVWTAKGAKIVQCYTDVKWCRIICSQQARLKWSLSF